MSVVTTFNAQSYTIRLIAEEPQSSLPLFHQSHSTVSDSSAVTSFLQEYIQAARLEGYLTASVDSVKRSSDTISAFVHYGQEYYLKTLSLDSIPPLWLSKVGFRPRQYFGKKINIEKQEKLLKELLNLAAEEGYPFASIRLDKVELENNWIQASVALEKGEYIRNGKLKILGSVKVDESYLRTYLGFIENEAYDQKAIDQMKSRLIEVPFFKLKKDPILLFHNGQVDILLDLDKKNASRLDLMLGLLPGDELLIVGDFSAQLFNTFGKADFLDLSIERLRPQSPKMEMSFDYPQLFNLPVGVQSAIQIRKYQDQYLSANLKAGLRYTTSGADYVAAYAQINSASLLSIDTQRIIQTGVLPDTLDTRRTSFGIEWVNSKLDYRFNPRKGYEWGLKIETGTRKVQKNSTIQNLGIDNLYTDISLQVRQYRTSASGAYYWPIGQGSTLKAWSKVEAVWSTEPLLRHELNTLGGNASLRGFNEESLLASQYGLLSLEYRLLLGQNSFLFTFVDAVAMRQELTSGRIVAEDFRYPYGMGAGMSFETQVGILNLSVAFGGQKGQSISLGSPKVHIGFQSLF